MVPVEKVRGEPCVVPRQEPRPTGAGRWGSEAHKVTAQVAEIEVVQDQTGIASRGRDPTSPNLGTIKETAMHHT